MTHPNPLRAGRTPAVILALCTIAALVLVPAPASADDPISAENFSPDGPGGTGPPQNATDDTVISVMSDRSDGGDSTFHATTVASTNTTHVEYYICPTAFPDSQVESGADVAAADPTLPANGCGPPVAQDTTGVAVPGAPAGTGEVYEAQIDITVDGLRDFVAWVCAGPTSTDADCDAEVESEIEMDDGSTNPGSATSSGEIIGPGHGANISNAGFTARARTSPDVTGVTFCLAIQGTVATDPANEGDGITAGDGDPTNCVEDADFAGPGSDSTIKTDVSPDNPAAQQATFKTWSVTYDAGETPDNLEMALVLIEGTDTDGDPLTGSPAAASGAGECAGGDIDCQLDSHYVVSTTPTGTTAVVAFPDEGDPDELPNDCDEPEATSVAESEPEQYTRVQGCVLDQSGNNITDTVNWAFELSPADPVNTATDESGFECVNAGPGKTCSDTNYPDETAAPSDSGEHTVDIGAGPASFAYPNYECNGLDPSPGPPFSTTDACPTGPSGADGTQRDANSDRFYEQADGDPGQTGAGTANIADQVLDFHTSGVYQVTFCLDSNNDAATSTTPCTGESVVATGTKTVTGPVEHVHVKPQTATDAECHTGESTVQAPAGTSFTLQGCALALVGTDEQGSIGAHVIWVLNPAGAVGGVGTLANAQNVTNSQGQATAELSSTSSAVGQTTTVRFCLDEHPASTTGGQDGNGTCDAAEAASGAELKTQADLQVNWVSGDALGLCEPLRLGAEQAEILIGTGGDDRICGFGGADTLRGLGGDDVLLGGPGDDRLFGGPGDDLLKGGSGRDKLIGGRGNDRLKGGPGKDLAKGGPGKDFCRAEKVKSCET